MRVRPVPVPLETARFQLPLFATPVRAGFPNPADDHIEQGIDLNDYLIRTPPATFLLEVAGDSMIGAGIFPGDMVIVDKSLDPQQNDVVIAVVEGEMTIKRMERQNGKVLLKPENPQFDTLVITPEMDASIWGVVTFTLHRLRPKKRGGR